MSDVQPNKPGHPAQLLPIDEKLIYISDWMRNRGSSVRWHVQNVGSSYSFETHLTGPGYVYQGYARSLIEVTNTVIQWIGDIEHDERQRQARAATNGIDDGNPQ